MNPGRFGRAKGPLLFMLALWVLCLPQVSYSTEDRESWGKQKVADGSFDLSVKNGLVSLHARHADLIMILREISAKSGIEIQIHPSAAGNVTASLHDMPIHEALERITDNLALVFVKESPNKPDRMLKAVIVPRSQTKRQIELQTLPRPPTIPPTLDSGNKEESVQRNFNHKVVSPKTTNKHKTSIQPKFVPNEIILKFKKGLTNEDIRRLITGTGATVKRHIQALNYYVLVLPGHLPVDEALAWYRQQNLVQDTEPNYLIPIRDIPNDPGFALQWSLHNTGQTGGTSDADIDAVEAWDLVRSGDEVVIAVIDTGVDYTHEDLAANIWQNAGEIPGNGVDDDYNGYVDDTKGWDFVDASAGASDEDFETQDNDPMDRHGHGTHVAGIAAAVADNGLGIAGVARNCRIMPVRAAYKTPSGDGFLESDDAAQALVYAAENGADVINLSWGNNQKSNLIEDAVNFATSNGAFICAAAGNENSTDRIYPAAIDNDAVLAVGATDSFDRKAFFSNYGDWVHVSAPGSIIYSTHLNNSYRLMSGTSMATPHAAGTAALIFSYFPELTSLDVKTRIMRSADILSDLTEKNVTSGRINAHSAIVEHNSAPFIFSASPNSVHEGDRITISGDNFGDLQEDGIVKFYPDLEAAVISWSDSVIVCTVPEGAQTGNLSVSTSEGDSNPIPVIILVKYYDETLIENGFLGAGQPQGWRADDQSWEYQLPFAFPFFGKEYDSVYVCSNGYLDFSNDTASHTNSIENLKTKVIIAPLWDDLSTNGSLQESEDIYIYSPSLDSVSIRWLAERYETKDAINTEVVLYEDGRIKFNYGSGNTNLSATIGISGGDGSQYHLSFYDGTSQLKKAKTALFTPHDELFTIDLELGWNLISLPLEPKDKRISNIMGSSISGIESIWGYIGGKWQVHIPGDSEATNFDTMAAGYGYWIKTNQTGLAILLDGKVKTIPNQLTEGWNLIGMRSLQNQSPEEALKDIGGTYEIAWGYDDGFWQVCDPHYPELSDLLVLEPGKGYWVKFSH